MRANWECMKKTRREKEKNECVCAHQQKIDQHRHRRVCILLSLYVSSSYKKKSFFSRIPENECVYFALLFPFYFSHSLCLDVSAKKKKHTHKTPFTSHIDCIKTAFLCIKISDSHCECMAMSHKQERERKKWTGKNKTMFCFALWHSVGARRPS